MASTHKRSGHYLFTSESVTEGHPDKVADQVSDAILDKLYEKDPHARVAVETLVTTGLCIVAGEVTTRATIDVQGTIRETIKNIGYFDDDYGFDFDSCGVLVAIHEQSPHIASGVFKKNEEEQGAGDQGCLKKGTLVRTDRGFVPIEEVQENDRVVTPSGLKRVVCARKTGRKKLFEIRLKNGMTLECTREHQILCYNRNGKTSWKAAAELKAGDFVCVLKPAPVFTDGYAQSHVDREQFFTKYNHRVYGPEQLCLDEDLGYVTGELIGDGVVSRPSSMEICFGNNEAHVPTVKSMLDAKLPNRWRTVRSNGNVSLKVNSVVLRQHFENFGVLRRTAPYKRTPQSIFTSPPVVVKSYLRGLFDSDGTIVVGTGRNKENVRVRLGSSSLKLLQETQLLLNDFGINSSILFNRPRGTPVGRDKRYASKHDSFVLSLTGFESYRRFGEDIGFLDPQKAKRLRDFLSKETAKPRNSRGLYLIPHPTKSERIDEQRLGKSLPFAVVPFKSRVEAVEDDVYDLEVEDAHLFSGNGIVVHNSMFGYACNETPELMPLPISLAHKLTHRLAQLRHSKEVAWFRPDGKSQVTVEYNDGKPERVHTVVVSISTDPDKSAEEVRRTVIEKVIKPVCGPWLDEKTVFHVNPAGLWPLGGPAADTGVTGRKIIVDTYGGVGCHGGGAFSGKDPSKVDRSASYMARHVAKNIVAAGLAEEAEVQVSYAIGVADPVSVLVNTYGTGKIPDEKLAEVVRKVFRLRPYAIINYLNLRRPIYRKTAAYGHFGREDPDFTWEATNKADELKREAELVAKARAAPAKH